jgi:branched-subunit amino acid ABC-type transport system permease component
MIMMVINEVVAVIWTAQWANTVFYIVLAVVLLVRPQGLFGRKGVRAQ